MSDLCSAGEKKILKEIMHKAPSIYCFSTCIFIDPSLIICDYIFSLSDLCTKADI